MKYWEYFCESSKEHQICQIKKMHHSSPFASLNHFCVSSSCVSLCPFFCLLTELFLSCTMPSRQERHMSETARHQRWFSSSLCLSDELRLGSFASLVLVNTQLNLALNWVLKLVDKGCCSVSTCTHSGPSVRPCIIHPLFFWVNYGLYHLFSLSQIGYISTVDDIEPPLNLDSNEKCGTLTLSGLEEELISINVNYV